MSGQRHFNREALRTFLERKAEEQFIVNQFFGDLDELGLESPVQRVRVYEKLGFYKRGTYQDLCTFLDLQPEESHFYLSGPEPEHCKCDDVAVTDGLLIRTSGAPKVKL